MYAIVDIETTGGSPLTDKITEIAIVLHNGKKVTKEYSTLINPERSIPYYITKLTGISNEMVADAPKFYEVAKDIIRLTDGMIFVAHNVNFDYNFIRAEFKHLGFEFKLDKLCTVRLGRKLIPGHNSYSLGKLCTDFNILIDGRHRALGDAVATAKIFDILLEANGGTAFKTLKDALEKKNLHPALDLKQVRDLPEECGVYYFRNGNGDLIYIGKSKNIRTRVLTHLGNGSTKKATVMATEIAFVDYEITGSELIALLKESHEIKSEKPIFNRSQRRTMEHSGIFMHENEVGYLQLEARKIKNGETPLVSFDSLAETKEKLGMYCKKFHLCQKLCGLYDTQSACFHYQINECKGACIGQEFAFSYNLRVDELVASFAYSPKNMVIIEEGRTSGEKGLVWIENGAYHGYGFLESATTIYQTSELKQHIKNYADNRDVQSIIKGYIKKHKKLRIEKF